MSDQRADQGGEVRDSFTRTLHFPEHQRLGPLCQRVQDDATDAWFGIGGAQGAITVPIDEELGLWYYADDLSPLAALRADDLYALFVLSTSVDDAQLAHIRHLTGLRELQLSRHPSITDAGLIHLRALRALQIVKLHKTGITDAGLSSLRDATALHTLELSSTGVTGPGLAYLQAHRALRDLDLSKTGVDDAGLASLPPLASLQTLRLDDTAVSDAGLAHLSQCKALSVLSLYGASVSARGVAALKRALPQCDVYADKLSALDEERIHPNISSGASGDGIADMLRANLDHKEGAELKTALEELRNVLPPPETPREAGSPADWAIAERALNFVFPGDYKEFVNVYGTGGVNDFIWLISPMPVDRPPLDQSYLLGPVASLRQMREEFGARACPYPLYPEPSGLVAWGQTTNGDMLYWRTEGQPETWPVVIADIRSAEFEEHPESMTSFLAKVLTGEIVTEMFPDDLLDDPPSYSQDFIDISG